MNRRDQGHRGIDKYNILFCTNINRHESPVRDYQQQPLFKKEEQYKDYYGVSNFKFPEVTTVSRTNHANFCELSFDGTKSSKHHHRRNNTIKRVTSATTINCATDKKEKKNLNEKEEEEEADQVIVKNKDTITFHHLAEQFKKKLKFIETPVKLHKNVVAKQKGGSTFEVILSPKTPTSYTSIETMSNMLQSSEHMHKQIIVTSKTFRPPPNNKPDMRDREIQTAIIGIRNINNLDDCFNVSLASVNDIFYNMDHLLPHNKDLFNGERRKRRELNLTVTHFPCVEIKCSSILFEMPAANTHRPQMPRRTINTNNNSIIEDYHEASNTDGKLTEPVTANSVCSSEAATDNLKDKIFSLFNDTQIAASQDFNKKVNDLCALIGNLVTDNKNKHEKSIKKSVKIPSEMFINIKKVKATDSNKQNTMFIPSYTSPKTVHKNSLHQKSSSNPSTPKRRSRSVSPPSRPSTPSCQISKIPVVDSVNQMNVTVTTASPRSCESNESRSKKKIFDPSHSKFSFTSIPSVSTMSSGSRHIRMVFDEDTDGTQTPQQPEKTVPRNVFVIPPHVNEILKKSEYNTACTLKKVFGEGRKSPPVTGNSAKPPNECHLINILKKPPIKQSWVVPDFVSKSQPKCDTINSFQCTKHTRNSKRTTDQDFSGPSVTFNSMVDVFGGDNESLEVRMCLTPDPKALQNTIVPVTALKKSKIYTNKPELCAVNDQEEEETNTQNSSLPARQTENKPKPIFEKQASFYNSSMLSPKKEASAATSCLQKRKDYDHKLKMQLQMQKQQSKIPLPAKVVILENNAIKSPKANKSKLPLKVTNEVLINNKQAIYSSNAQEFSKLFTTDIKDTPFSKLKIENTPRKQESQLSSPRPTVSILRNTQKNIERILNINKDVSNSINQDKEIIFIKYPESNFHKTRYKLKVDSQNVENNQKTNLMTDNSTLNYSNTAAPVEFVFKWKNMKKEKIKNQQKSFCPHQDIIFVYGNKSKLLANVIKNDSLTKRKKMMKQIQRDEKIKRSYPKLNEEKLNVVQDVKFKSSLMKMKQKVNKVTFMEPNKWTSLCRIQQCNKCECKEKREQMQKNLPKKQSINPKTLPTNVPKKSKNSTSKVSSKTSPPLDFSNIIKSCCGNLFSSRENDKKQEDDKHHGKKCCKFYKRKQSKEITPPPSTTEARIKFKQLADNLLTCCTTLCCKLEKNTLNNSLDSIPKSKSFRKDCKKCQQTHWLYVKPAKNQKVYRVNSYLRCNSCFISTSKGVLAKRKKPNPAWKFKELILNTVPNDLYNIIKYIRSQIFLFNQNKGDTNLTNGDTKQLIKIFPVSDENLEDTGKFSTIRIGDITEEVPSTIKNIKVINKGRFSKKTNNSSKNIKFVRQDASNLSKKIPETIFIPTSPRKVILSSKITTYTSPKKQSEINVEDAFNYIPTHSKKREDRKQNIPTFPFPWIRNISTPSEKIASIEIQNDTEQTAKRKSKFKDIPIKTATSKNVDDIKINNNITMPVFVPRTRRRLKNAHPVKFDIATRKIYEDKPKVLISPRQVNIDIPNKFNDTGKCNRLECLVKKISNTKFQSNDTERNNTSTSNVNEKHTITNIKDEAKMTKLPIPINHVDRKLFTPKKKVDGDEIKRKIVKRATGKRQITKLIMETNEIVHISDDDLIISLKSKDSRESKSTEYKSVIAYSGFSSNSQLSMSSNPRRTSSTTRTIFNLIGNFFRRYTKKVQKKKSQSINENG